MEEVKALDERSGGGNKAAQRRWLARVPESERPTAESSLDAKKKFVERAYIEGRYAGPEGSEAPGGAALGREAPGGAALGGEAPGGDGEGRTKGKKPKKEKSKKR